MVVAPRWWKMPVRGTRPSAQPAGLGLRFSISAKPQQLFCATSLVSGNECATVHSILDLFIWDSSTQQPLRAAFHTGKMHIPKHADVSHSPLVPNFFSHWNSQHRTTVLLCPSPQSPSHTKPTRTTTHTHTHMQRERERANYRCNYVLVRPFVATKSSSVVIVVVIVVVIIVTVVVTTTATVDGGHSFDCSQSPTPQSSISINSSNYRTKYNITQYPVSRITQ